jgi:hypothetical protein
LILANAAMKKYKQRWSHPKRSHTYYL